RFSCDWSSDVCSSDLFRGRRDHDAACLRPQVHFVREPGLLQEGLGDPDALRVADANNTGFHSRLRVTGNYNVATGASLRNSWRTGLMTAFECYAVTHPGLESLTAAELLALGVVGEVGPVVVSSPAELVLYCAADHHLRTASPALVRAGRLA